MVGEKYKQTSDLSREANKWPARLQSDHKQDTDQHKRPRRNSRNFDKVAREIPNQPPAHTPPPHQPAQNPPVHQRPRNPHLVQRQYRALIICSSIGPLPRLPRQQKMYNHYPQCDSDKGEVPVEIDSNLVGQQAQFIDCPSAIPAILWNREQLKPGFSNPHSHRNRLDRDFPNAALVLHLAIVVVIAAIGSLSLSAKYSISART